MRAVAPVGGRTSVVWKRKIASFLSPLTLTYCTVRQSRVHYRTVPSTSHFSTSSPTETLSLSPSLSLTSKPLSFP